MPTTHYELLGVAVSADADAIKKAYRALAKTHHPDRNPGNAEAAAKMAKINLAYEVLNDPAKRADYDAELAYGRAATYEDGDFGGVGVGFDPQSLINGFFGSGGSSFFPSPGASSFFGEDWGFGSNEPHFPSSTHRPRAPGTKTTVVTDAHGTTTTTRRTTTTTADGRGRSTTLWTENGSSANAEQAF